MYLKEHGKVLTPFEAPSKDRVAFTLVYGQSWPAMPTPLRLPTRRKPELGKGKTSDAESNSVCIDILDLVTLFHNKCLQTLHGKKKKKITILIKNWSVVIKNWSWRERESKCVCVFCVHACTVLEVSKTAGSKCKRKAIRVSVCLYNA